MEKIATRLAKGISDMVIPAHGAWEAHAAREEEMIQMGMSGVASQAEALMEYMVRPPAQGSGV